MRSYRLIFVAMLGALFVFIACPPVDDDVGDDDAGDDDAGDDDALSMAGYWSGEIDCGLVTFDTYMDWGLVEDGANAYNGGSKFYWNSEYYYEWNFGGGPV